MQYTGIILAGGKSSRMGEDKGLMLFEGKLMIEHIIDVLKPLVNEIIIIANNKTYQQFAYPVYEDIIKNKGPIAGIYTGLNYSKTTKNIILSCDVPFVNKEVLKLLMANCKDFDAVIPEKNGKTHQLIGIYDKSCLTVFKKELENDQRKLKLAVMKLNLKLINANRIDNKIFKNINSKDDIKA